LVAKRLEGAGRDERKYTAAKNQGKNFNVRPMLGGGEWHKIGQRKLKKHLSDTAKKPDETRLRNISVRGNVLGVGF